MIRSVGKRFLLFVITVLLVTIAINNAYIVREFRKIYQDDILLRCHYLVAELKSGVEKVIALGIPIDDIEGVDARCRQIIAGDPEIVYCLIEDGTGKILYSDDPSPFASGSESFVKATGDPGVVIVRHTRYNIVYDISAPILAPDGKVAGRARLGFPASVLTDVSYKILRQTALIFVLASLTIFVLVTLFVKRNLVNPISRMCAVAERVADGDFKVSMQEMSTREFERLGRALREMANSLRDRDGKIQDSYAELELANRELQASYESQERISVELASSREMYRALLENASDAILVIDAEDRVALINRAAESFFGTARSEIEGNNLFVVLSRYCDGRVEREYEMLQKIRDRNLTEFELSFVRPENGQRVVGWLCGSVIAGSDGHNLVQMTIRDITREKEIKENLERLTVDLQNLNAMKNSFLGMASHELKTPLTVISGYAELILTDMSDKLDKSVLAMVKYISDAADRLTAIVRDMIDVTLLDRRQMPLRRRLVDFNDLVRSAAREMEYFFHVRHQHLQLKLAHELPPVSCDPDRIFQVITNLVGNAVKFTPDGGTITVEIRLSRTLRAPGKAINVSNVEPLDLRHHSYVELVVRDTGIGIDEREQSQIFDKFYEVGKIEEHFTGKMAFKGRGTGLGLTIVKGIIDSHGGAIWVESAGHDPALCPGSEFHVLLPLAPPADLAL